MRAAGQIPCRDLTLWGSPTALVFAVLMRLGRRENGERLLKLLPVAVYQRFGLDVIGASHLSEAIVGWIATNGPKIQFP